MQINYPGPEPYTRTVEFKHITRQHSSKSVLCTEYPEASGEPYYPVPLAAGNALFSGYRSMAERETDQRGVWFAGRLATYRYVNMDEAIRDALVVASQSL